MCSKKNYFKKIILILNLVICDMFAIFFSVLLSIVLKNAFDFSQDIDIWPYLNFKLFYIIPICIFAFLGMYNKRYDFWYETLLIVKSCILGLILTMSVFAFAKINMNLSRFVIIFSFIFMMFFIPILKYILKISLFKLGIWKSPARTVGKNKELNHEIFHNPYLGYIVDNDNYDTLFIDNTLMPGDKLNLFLEQNIYKEKEMILASNFLDYDFSKNRIYTFINSRTNLIIINNSYNNFFNKTLKNIFDYTLAIILLSFLIPVFIIISLMIKIEDPKGSIFFINKRLGRNNKAFGCLKFRSMYESWDGILKEYLSKNPEEIKNYKIFHKYKNDPRITKIGKFLRKTSLDELPQLINILKGEMSLVGPRPYLIEEKQDMGHQRKLITSVKPGITGLWQVSGRSDVDFSTRLSMDAWYVKNWSIWNDIVILIKTIGVVIERKGAS